MTRRSFSLTATAALAQNRRPLIATGGILHETNTFNPKKTTLADFATGIGGEGILRGEAILREHEKANSTMAGVIAGARQYGFDLYPTITAGPQTIGTVTDHAFETLMKELLEKLRARKFDGVILTLHGTMVTESHAHADAEVVRRVREALGPAMPIVVTHDFHANVSEEIIRYSTALITYKENPHLDPKDRGIQAARIIAATARGEIRPVQALEKPPMLYNLVFQNTYHGPLKPITDESKRLETQPKILAASVAGGYQWSDIPAMGPSVVVVTDNDIELARREAKRLSGMVWDTRHGLKLKLPDAAEAVRLASANAKHPVVLMDTGDNIGGGSAGDSTFILAEFIKQKAPGWFICISDPEAVKAAFRAGVGGVFDMPVGGKTDKLHGEPVRVKGRVKSLSDGQFMEPLARHGGMRYWDMGLTAVIEAEGSTRDLQNILQVTTKRVFPASLNQLISTGIYPDRQRILVAKGTVAPRAAYEPIAARIIETDTPGTTAVNPDRFVYKRIRKGLSGMY
ncbi:MAG: M81 family metallopeptidase [Acidobacteria bacterium]|nr:M81 family metallopeptidase [Acidobacteriota bacterium]